MLPCSQYTTSDLCMIFCDSTCVNFQGDFLKIVNDKQLVYRVIFVLLVVQKYCQSHMGQTSCYVWVEYTACLHLNTVKTAFCRSMFDVVPF